MDPTLDSSSGPSVPDLSLAQDLFLLRTANLPTDVTEAAQKRILTAIDEGNMAPLYYYIHTSLDLATIPWDEEKYKTMTAKNEEDVNVLQTPISEAEMAGGEMEIAEGWIKVGEFWASVGDKEKAIFALRKAHDLSPGLGSKIDVLFTIIRVGLFFDDKTFVGNEIENVKVLIERGGDWDRRNRLKTYNGLYLLSTRKFSEAADLFLDSLSTFTSTELCKYEELVQYAILAAGVSLGRVPLKTKVIDSPEILSLMSTTPSLEPLTTMTNSLYLCDYASFFKALVDVNDSLLKLNRYLAPHSKYYVKEMRRRGYSQLLESYRALSLKSMAEAFGVSVEFLDSDLSKFIPQKKINCVIDRVNGIIETNRPDNKNAQYQLLVKQGDVLLTRLQKYGTAVRMSGSERVA
ncbi:26S proteasome subunit RPN7-domain-containing protein [Kockiozyma suomiensis]|uniref:26S proteasome subunit RPN7-domain-containing protein n=1 Tax=Kockiozyma suomiensis TaxID=1337062 RepID=UPI003343C2B4